MGKAGGIARSSSFLRRRRWLRGIRDRRSSAAMRLGHRHQQCRVTDLQSVCSVYHSDIQAATDAGRHLLSQSSSRWRGINASSSAGRWRARSAVNRQEETWDSRTHWNALSGEEGAGIPSGSSRLLGDAQPSPRAYKDGHSARSETTSAMRGIFEATAADAGAGAAVRRSGSEGRGEFRLRHGAALFPTSNRAGGYTAAALRGQQVRRGRHRGASKLQGRQAQFTV